MERNTRKNKLFISIAISIIAILLLVSVVQIIFINKQTKTKQRLEQEITRLENANKFYENQNKKDDSMDDKNIDNEIVLGGEQ